jgi:release factor glutamine methyltransferase
MKALRVARENVHKFDLEKNIKIVCCDLLKPFSGHFDIICANLPYIPTSRLAKLDVSKREPLLALDGGDGGFQLIKRLLEDAAYRLSKGGLLLAEIDIHHSAVASDLARNIFPSSKIQVLSDMAGLPRLMRIDN